MIRRVATALILIPLVIYVAVIGPGWLLYSVVAAVALACFREYLGLAAAFGLRRAGPLGYAAGLIVLLVPRGDVLMVTLVAVCAITVMLRSQDLRDGLPGASVLVFGVVYAFGPGAAPLRCTR
jgi:CDP-diglyceride synthetase